MADADNNLNLRLDRASEAVDRFIRDYSDKMRYPVSQLLSIVEYPGNNKRIGSNDLESLSRIIREIDQILTGLMHDLEDEHSERTEKS
jgi:hypothetical protein